MQNRSPALQKESALECIEGATTPPIFIVHIWNRVNSDIKELTFKMPLPNFLSITNLLVFSKTSPQRTIGQEHFSRRREKYFSHLVMSCWGQVLAAFLWWLLTIGCSNHLSTTIIATNTATTTTTTPSPLLHYHHHYHHHHYHHYYNCHHQWQLDDPTICQPLQAAAGVTFHGSIISISGTPSTSVSPRKSSTSRWPTFVRIVSKLTKSLKQSRSTEYIFYFLYSSQPNKEVVGLI